MGKTAHAVCVSIREYVCLLFVCGVWRTSGGGGGSRWPDVMSTRFLFCAGHEQNSEGAAINWCGLGETVSVKASKDLMGTATMSVRERAKCCCGGCVRVWERAKCCCGGCVRVCGAGWGPTCGAPAGRIDRAHVHGSPHDGRGAGVRAAHEPRRGVKLQLGGAWPPPRAAPGAADPSVACAQATGASVGVRDVRGRHALRCAAARDRDVHTPRVP